MLKNTILNSKNPFLFQLGWNRWNEAKIFYVHGIHVQITQIWQKAHTICNTSSRTFEYEFKVVKFGIIGTFSPDHYSFTVEVEGDSYKVDSHTSTRNEYSLLYVSEDLEYKEHKISIRWTSEIFWNLQISFLAFL